MKETITIQEFQDANDKLFKELGDKHGATPELLHGIAYAEMLRRRLFDIPEKEKMVA